MTQAESDRIKALSKRVAMLEELIEIAMENDGNIIRALRMIAARLNRASGSSDPFDLVMMGPHNRPAVLPPGLAEELSNPVHKWAIGQLSQEEADEFHRKTQLIYRLRKMRADREAAKKPPVSCVNKTPGGGAPGATHGLSF